MALFDSTMFNPATYSGNMGGGLLGYLAQALKQQGGQEQQIGPTVANGDQGSMGGVPFPIFGQQDQASLPKNAQPTQANQQQSSGFGDRLLAGLTGFAGGGAPLPAIANLISGITTGKIPFQGAGGQTADADGGGFVHGRGCV